MHVTNSNLIVLTPSLKHSLFTVMMMSVLVDGDDRSEDDDRSSSDARLLEENRVCVCVSLLPSIGHALI